VLDAGADKVSVNSAALRRPELIGELAETFGAQCVVIAIDAKRRVDDADDRPGSASPTCEAPRGWFGDDGEGWDVYLNGGRSRVEGREAVAWAREAVERGAGEVLLTSMDRDGTTDGYDIELTRAVAEAVPVPVIASGGVGTLDHLVEGIRDGHASAVLAASIFHFGEYTVRQAKEHMAHAGLPMRLDF